MTITQTDLTATIKKWGNGLIAISTAYENGGIEKATGTADNVLDQLYGFEFGPILFKPTLSGGEQTFRPTKQGTLSYFVGNDPQYPSDTGFGLKYWREVKSETSAVMLDETIAMWMGWVKFTDKYKNLIKVEKSFGFRISEKGDLKIILHHSSLPYEE